MSTKAYRDSHKAEIAAYDAAYALANPERIRIQSARYREKNKAAIAVRAKLHALKNPERFRRLRTSYHAKWRESHRQLDREIHHRRRARLRGQRVEVVNIDAVFERDKGICHICNRRVARAAASIDHLKPLSKGGAHAMWNVRIAHRRCNSSRGNRGPAQLLLAPVGLL